MLLVDGHNLLWRAAFGFPAAIMSRDKTRDLTAEFGFFALLRVAIRDELPAPPEVLVVFDGEHGTADRKDADASYKANRVRDEAALKPLRAIPHVQEALTLYGVQWIEIDTAEADDVIASLVATTRQQTPNRQVWIMSGDRDFYQLVGPRTRVLNTVMKRGKRHIGPDEVYERFGVTPAQWPDFCALKGDPADNIPGIKGVGLGTAAKLLAGDLVLEQILDSGRLTGARRATALATWEQVLGWRELIRMRADLPLEILPTGTSSAPLPRPAEVIEKLGLW
ncbi:5'-3' exonuclease H3TH domain-containing protein [Amycolatopsis sp. NPDC059657]|uniref:5'-3' exonuclease n=1 Tax=Amycolatopsis sp. NPDC059657 TaxID=3346899 RepID=UPI00366CA035